MAFVSHERFTRKSYPSSLPERHEHVAEPCVRNQRPAGHADHDHDESDDQIDVHAHGHQVHLGHGTRHEAGGQGGDEKRGQAGHGDTRGGVKSGVQRAA